MKKHIKYPKIGQYRNVVETINQMVSYVGLDENEEPIYDIKIKKPILEFTGTVKLHGTNASVCYNSNEGMWVQSRKNILTVASDNAGFAQFVDSNRERFMALVHQVIVDNEIDITNYTVAIYGEWAGKGIQKGVGICDVDRAFYIFGVKLSKPQDEEFSSIWLPSSNLKDEDCSIFNIQDFETYTVTVDFNNPELSQNEFIRITESVEHECPVAKRFGIENGVGEGVVWSTEFKGNVYRFKVKGEKHTVTKVKKMASIDVEKMKSISDFVEYSVTENRFDQAIENVFKSKEKMDIKKMGEFIKWFVNDIASEEMDTMLKNDLIPKDVNRSISKKVRTMFFDCLKF